jgi:argininosuccinate lyase
MSTTPFSPIYVNRVLDPAYQNWKAYYYKALIDVQKAHLCMLYDRKIISSEIAFRIARALYDLQDTFVPPTHIPQNSEDLYFLFESSLFEVAGEDAAWLHTARSRNDMDTTVFRLSLRERLLSLLERNLFFFQTLIYRCKEGEEELTVLFTHGQPANPSTIAHYLSSFLMEMIENTYKLIDAIKDVNRSTMGACAITGSGFDIDREGMSKSLGFDSFIVNTYQAISTSHWLISTASCLQVMMVDVGRFVVDMLHKVSAEVGLLRFPDELVQISSIMPQKRNPVILEHIRIQAEAIAGDCQSIIQSFHNVPFQDVNENADMLITRMICLIDQSYSVFDLLEESLIKMKSNTERAREVCYCFGVTTTELADTLVRKFSVGFRKAHKICSEFEVKGQEKEALRRIFLKSTGQKLNLSDQEIDEILSPERFISVRSTNGGPSSAGMKMIYESANNALNDFEECIRAYRNKWDSAKHLLNKRFDSLLKSP